MFLGCRVFVEPCPENDVPKFGAHSITSILNTEMMLVMVSLKAMEVAPFTLSCVNMMQSIMSAVIDQVSKQESSSIKNIKPIISSAHQSQVGMMKEDVGAHE